jgi:hypothetical protein
MAVHAAGEVAGVQQFHRLAQLAVMKLPAGGNLGNHAAARRGRVKQPAAVGAEGQRVDIGGADHSSGPGEFAQERTGAPVP